MTAANIPKLTELIDVSILQKMQDSFSSMTGLASTITDASGIALTNRTSFCEFCHKYTRQTPMGEKLCEKCGSYGARETYERGRSVPYYCHAGLIDFSAPIVADGTIIGCFVGGQVLDRPPNEARVRRAARELDIDEDLYWEAARKVNMVDKAYLKRTANFINSLAHAISNMANGKLLALRAQADLEKADQMKSDFLANMSHEIRTPMNAVIGMADMALRQNLPPFARNYLEQIKSSGKALLNIINDVLDYSKIESGILNISPEDYEPLSVINDVSTIVMNRLMHKNVEFLLDVDPALPKLLNGDCQRLRQILINLANNAVKFTDEGFVRLTMRYDDNGDGTATLHFFIRDTGIGIKPEDLPKLFGSFAQVDKKRNKHVEGTGLGLSIVKQLLSLMGGDIDVESVYGKGSTFSFSLPQKIVDPSPSIQVDDPDKYIFVGHFARKDVAADFADDAAKIGIRTIDVTSAPDAKAAVEEIVAANSDKEVYCIVEQPLFERGIENDSEFMKPEDKNLHSVLLADAFADVREWRDIDYLIITKKPVSVLSLSTLILNRDDYIPGRASSDDDAVSFVAPDARILLVDDNAINLTVAEGLLEPINMTVDKALSGKEALSKIEQNKYDIIFMDHMMPEMDGVETTRVIRRFHPEYNEIPIIALTANAVSGAREMFLNEGMNDFVAKPIEYRILESKVKQWLPPEKIRIATAQEQAELSKNKHEVINIGDLDTETARKMLGNDNLFWNILKEYYRTIDSKSKKVQEFFDKMDWPNYTIEVHSIKSASRQIGAMQLADSCARLEQAGNIRDESVIRVDTPDMLFKYRSYIDVLRPFIEKDDDSAGEKPPIDKPTMDTLIGRLRFALSELDLDEMETVSNELNAYSYDADTAEKIEALTEAIANIDVDACEEVISSL